MLLRGSGEHSGDDYDLRAIASADGAASGVRAADALARYADAFFADGDGFARAREALLAEIGAAALVDAAAVLAIFDAVVRIADATGIPLEDYKAAISADFRGALGIDAYPSTEGKF